MTTGQFYFKIYVSLFKLYNSIAEYNLLRPFVFHNLNDIQRPLSSR
jgi:hypothetical protein